MTRRHSGRLQKATALVPLAVLSAAWTVNVTGLGGTTADAADTVPTAASADSAPATLPDGTPLPPAIGLNQPASVTGPTGDHISKQQAGQIVSSAQDAGIPAAALAAYQRAATVIDSADKSCNLDWQLLAAIGRVESNHGRAEGNTLSSQGISTPGIFGPELNGRNGTSDVPDTDGGLVDGDTKFDRAVGPMQFIPSTWSIVSVDADGDGQRNPQDINDAALASAVYLCSGNADLSSLAGQRSAVYRYNHSASYVSTVLAVMQAYLAGDYTSVPNSALVNDYVFEPSTPAPRATHHAASKPASHPASTSTGPKSPTTPKAPKKSGTGPKSTGGNKTTPPVTTPQPPAVDKTISEAQALTECEAKVLPSAVQTTLGSVLGGDLTSVVNALTKTVLGVPVIPGGPGLAADLQSCVTDKTSGS